MFARLMRQEFLDNRKSLGMILGGSLLAILVSTVLALLKIPFLSNFGRLTLFVIALVVFFGVLVQLAESYWKTMAGPRGYFTHTIPVRGRELYAAKVLFAFLAGLVGLLVAFLAFGIGFGVNLYETGMSVLQIIEGFVEGLRAMPRPILLLGIIWVPLYLLGLICSVASVMSIGAQGRWNRHGFGAPAVGLVLLYVLNQAVSVIGMLFVPLLLDVESGALEFTFMLPMLLDSLRTGAEPAGFGIGSLIMSGLLAIIMAWWGIRSIERRTSLR